MQPITSCCPAPGRNQPPTAAVLLNAATHQLLPCAQARPATNCCRVLGRNQPSTAALCSGPTDRQLLPCPQAQQSVSCYPAVRCKCLVQPAPSQQVRHGSTAESEPALGFRFIQIEVTVAWSSTDIHICRCSHLRPASRSAIAPQLACRLRHSLPPASRSSSDITALKCSSSAWRDGKWNDW